jgi:hypothetical protein
MELHVPLGPLQASNNSKVENLAGVPVYCSTMDIILLNELTEWLAMMTVRGLLPVSYL